MGTTYTLPHLLISHLDSGERGIVKMGTRQLSVAR
jgi:hypothetical protein